MANRLRSVRGEASGYWTVAHSRARVSRAPTVRGFYLIPLPVGGEKKRGALSGGRASQRTVGAVVILYDRD